MVALQGRGEAASEAARFEAQKERKLALQAHMSLFNRCGWGHWSMQITVCTQPCSPCMTRWARTQWSTSWITLRALSPSSSQLPI